MLDGFHVDPGWAAAIGAALLRRSGTVPPLPWSTFAPPLTTTRVSTGPSSSVPCRRRARCPGGARCATCPGPRTGGSDAPTAHPRTRANRKARRQGAPPRPSAPSIRGIRALRGPKGGGQGDHAPRARADIRPYQAVTGHEQRTTYPPLREFGPESPSRPAPSWSPSPVHQLATAGQLSRERMMPAGESPAAGRALNPNRGCRAARLRCRATPFRAPGDRAETPPAPARLGIAATPLRTTATTRPGAIAPVHRPRPSPAIRREPRACRAAQLGAPGIAGRIRH